MRALPCSLLLALAACGSAGTVPRCASDADCGAGTVCTAPTGSEAGVCVPAFRVALTAPGANAWVGTTAAVRATVAVQASGRTLPDAVDLLLGTTPVGQLLRDGASSVYQGSWSPAQGTPEAVALRAVAARGTRDESSSPPLPVRVDRDLPGLGLVTLECAGPCLRDGALSVRTIVNEPNLAAVTATLDLDPVRAFPLAKVGTEWRAEVDLRGYPFPHLAGPVLATVKVTDLAGNEVTGVGSAQVTRVKWATRLDPTPGFKASEAAVDGNGRIVVGGTNGRLYFVDEAGSVVASPQVASAGITAAPSIGTSAIWVASDDFRLYAVDLAGTTVLNPGGCNTGGAIPGAPAIAHSPSEVAVGSSASGRLYAANPGGLCAAGPVTDPFSSPPAIGVRGKVLAATETTAATLRGYTFDGLAFTPVWGATVGVSVGAPIAVDAADTAWTGSSDGKLNSTTEQGATTIARSLAGSVGDSAVVLSNGDVAVGDRARTLYRLKPSGALVWSATLLVTGGLLAPLVLTGGDAALLVPSTVGSLHAVGGDGTELWQGGLSAQALRAGNISGAAGTAFSTAYFGSDDGSLYAVVVDGHLDTAAPWPKAHHDVRNTSNAGSSLP